MTPVMARLVHTTVSSKYSVGVSVPITAKQCTAVDSGDHFMTLATTAHSRGGRVATCGVPDWGGDITRYGTWNM